MKRLEIKIITERIKEELEEFEIKRLEIETEIKTKILKQTQKTVKKNLENELKELEAKEIIEITTEKELKELEIDCYCFKLPFKNIISF